MSEIMQKAIAALADSPLTTKGVIVTGAGSWMGRFLEVMPDIISITGACIAGLAGFFLFIRHRKAGKLDDARRVGVNMQNAHDAKMQALEYERVQLELERFKSGSA